MKNRKVLIVSQYFYPENISSGILPFELSKELVKNQFEVKALVGYPKEYIDGKAVCRKEYSNLCSRQLLSDT